MTSRRTSRRYTYEIFVHTGDRLYSGTDANVYITLCGQGFKSEETELDYFFSNEFEAGQTDAFTISNTPVPKVESLELRRGWSGSDWFLASISVKSQEDETMVEFPVLRWINGDITYKLIPYDTCLPQDDIRSEQRTNELLEKQKTYTYRSWYPDLPEKTSLPSDENFSLSYKLDVFGKGLKLKLVTLLKSFRLKEFKNIDDIKSMYTSCGFAIPQDMEIWNDDRKFALQRLTGVNIRQIALCTEIPTTMGVTSEMVNLFLEGKSLADAVVDRRVFIVDHQSLHDVCPNTDLTVCAPIALFYQRNNGSLMPIAIQLFQKKGKNNPVFLPTDDKYTWILAKMWFNNADAQVHEGLAHLGYTHLFMEGVVIASNRQLSLSHPILKLLKPHFLYLLAINSLAVTDLLNKPDGFINTTMSIGTDEGLRLIHKNRSVWRLDVQGTLPKELKSRGVDNPELLPDYYYREDAMELYNATKRYVTDYVNIYYKDDTDLIEDHEIQAWRTELTKEAPFGAGLLGVPGTDDLFVKKEELISTLTSVIFTCSAEHAAVNFPQYDEYAFPLNYPSRLRGTPPKDKKPRTMTDVMKSLPKPRNVMEGNIIFTILSTRGTKALEQFEIDYVYDPRGKKVVDRFRDELAAISKNVEEKQKSRRETYLYLDPKEVPNAISI